METPKVTNTFVARFLSYTPRSLLRERFRQGSGNIVEKVHDHDTSTKETGFLPKPPDVRVEGIPVRVDSQSSSPLDVQGLPSE